MASSEQNQSGRAQDEILAGKYVLGVLAPEARRSVEHRMASDHAFAKLVKRWQADLASLQEEEADVNVSFSGIHRSEQQAAPRTRPTAAGFFWNSAPFWRCVAVAAAAMAMIAVVHDSIDGQQATAREAQIADMPAAGGSLDLLASYEPASGRLRLTPAAAGLPDEKVLQLWLRGGDGAQHSLGILPRGTRGEIILPAEMRRSLRQGGQLAISLESPGGSMTGAPAGPVIAAGLIQGF